MCTIYCVFVSPPSCPAVPLVLVSQALQHLPVLLGLPVGGKKKETKVTANNLCSTFHTQNAAQYVLQEEYKTKFHPGTTT